ncbi:hypothetical protein CEP48_00455 [Mergibacter septicus]|uniref:Uncharacterized protein n=1 Tax=Mergibacter septicus TaxID=221402 RepID=A0A8D4IZ41_9PAST|nr:YcfL family protein [Mergibacter septicus]AWX14749.1 hypothetical protein CEP47_00455 [Mergibacter septicus]QDJ13741.1 hypothetical protein CEP45_07785 [Mergibacter septicus]QDJ14000.1 hypothetical protein CEP48_00455 [Mergibacter septicus]UTU48551.1 YcfL family protein [Mergibacter septicus]WMR95820.1 YcfL family protein [Mergibacter septicus]
MKQITAILLIFICTLTTVACNTSSPNTYLIYSRPVINITAPIAEAIEVNTDQHNIRIKNQSEKQISLAYKLTWYDQNGVTQPPHWQQAIEWNELSLAAKQVITIPLNPATPISVNYRLFIREN